jgi:two-component system, OmpR family, sensor kinase
MSSNRADLDRLRGLVLRPRPRSWSLRTRLVATLALLLIASCAGIGAGTLLAMRHFLMGQLDNQVNDASSRSLTFFDLGPPPFIRFPGPGPVFLDGPGQSAETVGAVVTGGRVDEAAVILTSGDRQSLTSAAASQLANLPLQQPVSLHLDPLGDYRVMAVPADGGHVVVSGMPLSAVHATLLSVVAIFGGLGALALALAVVVGILIVGRQLRPLSVMASTAYRVARLELTQGDVSLPTPVVRIDPAAAHTEVGRLGSALTEMVDRISEALAARHATEMMVRQFVADASHELRTPLTSIRGYTEVARRLTDGAPTDLSRVLERVESEARRMSSLVEDMLLLARLDEGRPLREQPVDLSQLIIDAVSDAHVAGPDHRWALDLPDEPVTVIGDQSRLHQVLANLLSNARVHTPPGTKVTSTLNGADDDGVVVVQVIDNGPGIPADQQQEIFQRFVRGDTSRSRRAGSTGLGLAIASAVVAAHHGSIRVDSVPTRTTFTVELPTRSRRRTEPSPRERPLTPLPQRQAGSA